MGLVVLAVVGCRDRETARTGRPAEVPADLPDHAPRVAAILEQTRARTQPARLTLPDGTEVDRLAPRPREVTLPRGRYTPDPSTVRLTEGEIVWEGPLHEAPVALLVDEQGAVVTADGNGVVAHARDAAAPRPLADWPAQTAQWNGEGTELLLSGPEHKVLLSWPEAEVVWNGDGRADLQGFLAFAPRGDGFWLMRDTVSFDADADIRIVWGVWEVPRDGGSRREVKGSPAFASALGTIPQLEMVWGHVIEPHKLFPDPAPLWQFDHDLECVSPKAFLEDQDLGWRVQLTRPGEGVDLSPSGERSGRLVFVRANRRVVGDEGVQLGPSARGWTTTLGGDPEGRPLTAEPTMAIACSPGGAWTVMTVVRNGRAVVLRAELNDLLAADLSEPYRAQRRLERVALQVTEDLRAAMAELERRLADPAAPRIDLSGETYAEQRTRHQPTVTLVDGMESALRRTLERRAQVKLVGDITDLAVLDGFLTEMDGLVPEEASTTLAVAAVYGNALVRAGHAEWMLDSAMPYLSFSLTRDVTHEMEFGRTLHAPFHVARERLAGRVPLHERAQALLESTWMPVVLVENFGQDTLPALVVHEAKKCGIAEDADPTPALMQRIVTQHADNGVMNRLVETWAVRGVDPDLELAATLNRATLHPEQAHVLTRAADALLRTEAYPEAMALYEMAERLAPDNLDVLLEVASGYATLGRLDEADLLLDRAELVDRLELGVEVIEATRDLIALLRQAMEEPQ
ncbi:MAG: tetratricopeptide repeat protein [Candidatus Sumerlaeia bacterium]|nr:tetratricopeptide repeat protein [Candidatus Sumerlaeia bacterium]